MGIGMHRHLQIGGIALSLSVSHMCLTRRRLQPRRHIAVLRRHLPWHMQDKPGLSRLGPKIFSRRGIRPTRVTRSPVPTSAFWGVWNTPPHSTLGLLAATTASISTGSHLRSQARTSRVQVHQCLVRNGRVPLASHPAHLRKRRQVCSTMPVNIPCIEPLQQATRKLCSCCCSTTHPSK